MSVFVYINLFIVSFFLKEETVEHCCGQWRGKCSHPIHLLKTG